MNEQRLLAAIALFRELYDNNKNIYDILAEFIRTAILLNSKWNFNSVECTDVLGTTFGFEIPEAVIRSCLKNRLIRSGELTLSHGTYSITDSFDRTKDVHAEFTALNNAHGDITAHLVSYVNEITAPALSDDDATQLKSDFGKYLMGETIPKEHAKYCSLFVIAHQNDTQFKAKLNRIEEGLVLYAGIKHSTEVPTTAASWRGDLTIFLDTEHLFNATGLNGILYKRIFDDFHNLVKEVNQSKFKSGSITLRYFDEAMKEVEKFFSAAEFFVEKHQAPPSFKPAMVSITNGCNTKSDVIQKKTKFYDQLRRLRIEAEQACDYYSNPKYNIESAATAERLQKKFAERTDSEDAVKDALRLFTKVNCLRKGESHGGLERVGAILMTANSLTTAISLCEDVYPGNGAVPFATNVEFMIERLWFKLNKGLGGQQSIPAVFDVITRAQLVLSSQINNQVSENFRILREKFNSGEITKEEAALLNHELRSKSFKPEEITHELLGESIEFLSSSYIEDAIREKALLERDVENGKRAIATLEKLKRERKSQVIAPLKKRAKIRFYVWVGSIYTGAPFGVLYFLRKIYSTNDTNLSIVFGAATVISLISFAKCRALNSYLWSLSKKRYIAQRRNIR